jgi:outer membrane protein assembly factor BamB
LAEFQSFILSGDTSLILYASPDGPMQLDLRSGATLWTSRQAFTGARVPSLADYAAMMVIDSTLFIPRDKGLIALDSRTGQVRWRADTLLPRRATRLASVPSGLLVRAGADFVTVLDPATGAPRWAKPFTLRTDGAAYEIVGNHYYLMSRDRLIVADLATGDTTLLGRLRLKDNESASQMLPAGDDLTIVSRQNLIRVDLQGAVRYQRYYRAPTSSPTSPTRPATAATPCCA